MDAYCPECGRKAETAREHLGPNVQVQGLHYCLTCKRVFYRDPEAIEKRRLPEMSKSEEATKRPPEPNWWIDDPTVGAPVRTEPSRIWQEVREAERQFGCIMAELMVPSGKTQFVAVAKTDFRAVCAYRCVLELWAQARAKDLRCKIMDRVDEEFAAYATSTTGLALVSPDLRRAIGQFVVKMLGEQEASARDETETPT